MTTKTNKTVTYFDPSQGRIVAKNLFPFTHPPAANTLPSGATVQEIDSAEDLKTMWNKSLISDLASPLAQHGRGILQSELLRVIVDASEREAIDTLCSTHHFNDDRLLKLIGRLVGEIDHQREKQEKTVTKRENLLHEKEMWLQEKQRLKDENKALLVDVQSIMQERDKALKFSDYNADSLRAQVADLQNALATAVVAVEADREDLRRDAARNIEIALTEYESAVVGKLGSVAAEHKVVMDENRKLKEELSATRELLSQTNAQVQKESVMMNEIQNNNVVVEVVDELRAGDEVYCKVSGEGPFVLMTQVDEAVVEYANPISNKRNSFNCGKLPIHNAWLVRCKDGTMRTLPAPALTKARPKSSFSLGGIKSLVTSDVTAKLFQAAIWAAMLTLLYMRS